MIGVCRARYVNTQYQRPLTIRLACGRWHREKLFANITATIKVRFVRHQRRFARLTDPKLPCVARYMMEPAKVFRDRGSATLH